MAFGDAVVEAVVRGAAASGSTVGIGGAGGALISDEGALITTIGAPAEAVIEGAGSAAVPRPARSFQPIPNRHTTMRPRSDAVSSAFELDLGAAGVESAMRGPVAAGSPRVATEPVIP